MQRRDVRVHECDVDSDAGAVPTGRHFTAAALDGLLAREVVDAAELVVTELLTNALLHGAAPVRLRVCGREDGTRARVEVHDASRALPVRPMASTDSMTGRGLALVDALSDGWGVLPNPDGSKAVWAELTPESVLVAEPGEVDLDALLAGFADEGDLGQPRFTVTLGDVPTELLLAAKAHVDNVVRELMLASSGAESGMTGAVPASLATLVHDVVNHFAEARQAIKRQALSAAQRGEERATLRLTLPADAAEAGERYLAALEEADAYGRASRLLTLAAPPQHAAFRRWYVSSLISGLRRASAGEEAVVASSFESYLLAEVDHLAELQEVSDRAARLQRVTAALGAVLDREEVARIALDDAVTELRATRGVLLLVTPHDLRTGARVGYTAATTDALRGAWDRGILTPALLTRETGHALWVESREELDSRFPAAAVVEPDLCATCVVPLTVAGHMVGILRLSFDEPRMFTADERAFVTALGAVAAQALERADLYDARGSLAERLIRLQEVTAALAVTHTVDDVLDVAIEHAVGLMQARVASLCLLRADGRTVDLHRMAPEKPEDPHWWTFDVDDDLPASEAIRTGQLLWAPNLAARDARWPSVAHTMRDFDHSFVAVPLHAEGSTLGALTLSFAVSETAEEPSHDFLVAFGDVCGQALQRARAAEAAATAGRKLAFLARASEELSGTLDIETTLGNLARLTVPEIADWCVVHLLQDEELACVAVEHVDPAVRELGVELQRRWPEQLDSAGVGRVVRTGQPMLVASVETAPDSAPEEPDAAGDPEREELVARLGLRSMILAPLTARGRTLGALSFMSAESGREYGPADLAFVEDLARRAAVAVDNARLYTVATGPGPTDPAAGARLVQRPRAESLPGHADDALLRWQLAQEAGRLGSWDLDARTLTLSWDEQCADLFGTSLGLYESEFAAFQDRLHPDDLERVMAVLRVTIDTGAPFDVEYRAVLPDGRLRHLLSRARGVPGPDGRVARVVGAVVDVTELREAASAESRSARLLAGLGDVAMRLAAAATVADLTQVVIEQGLNVLGADGGAVCVRDDERGTIRLTVSQSLPSQVQEEFPELPLDGPLPGSYTARTGETVLLPTRQSGLDFAPEMAVVYEGTGRSAWASLPLRAGGRLLGSLVVSWTQERAFPLREQELLSAFAAQCAQALDRMQTLEAERRAARSARRLSETLQRSLLTRPPEPDHLEVSVRYVPASQEAQVGGDWYDAFITRDGALNLVIGDCTGHDREAVAAMAAVRNLLRATAYAVDGEPAAVLTSLEETMGGLDVTALATALLARVEQTEEHRRRGVREMVWSSAGHLPPVLRSADGQTVVLRSTPDLMLGLMPSTDRSDHRIEIQPGTTVVLYTDGLIERRGEDLDTGIERLRSALGELGDLPLADVCDALLARLGDDAEDDVALLAVRFHPED